LQDNVIFRRNLDRGSWVSPSQRPDRLRSVIDMPTVDTGKPRARRGFAAMNPERRREIARKGGASVPGEKRSFAKDRDLAASAGRKGGEASRGGGRTRGREI
jgi:general stress protein YciG